MLFILKKLSWKPLVRMKKNIYLCIENNQKEY